MKTFFRRAAADIGDAAIFVFLLAVRFLSKPSAWLALGMIAMLSPLFFAEGESAEQVISMAREIGSSALVLALICAGLRIVRFMIRLARFDLVPRQAA